MTTVISTLKWFCYHRSQWLVLIVFFAYSLWPSSAPLILDGIPFNTKIEFLCFLFVSFLLISISLAKMLERCRYIDKTQHGTATTRIRLYLGIVTVLLIAAVGWVKFETPVSEGIQSCIVVPHISTTDCVFSLDAFQNSSTTFSRSVRNLTFGGTKGWSIGAFNTERFFSVRKRFASHNTRSRSPFKLKFRLGNNIVDVLQETDESSNVATFLIQYTGGMWIDLGQGDLHNFVVYPFSKTISTALLNVPKETLKKIEFTYVNYICNPTERFVLGEIQKDGEFGNYIHDKTCHRTWNIDSLHDYEAHLRILPLVPRSDSNFVDADILLLTANRLFSFSSIIEKIMLLALVIFIFFPILEKAIRYFAKKQTVFSFSRLATGFRLHYTSNFYNSLTGGCTSSERSSVGRFNVIVIILLALTTMGLAYGYFALATPYDRPFLESWWRPQYAFVYNLHFIIIISLAILFSRFRVAASEFLKTYKRYAYYLILTPPTLFLCQLIINETPKFDDIGWLRPGDDPLTWAAYGKNVVREKSIWLDPTSVLSKPFFIYFRAIFYMLLGDGEIYYRNFTVIFRLLTFSYFFCVLTIILITHKHIDAIYKKSHVRRLGIVCLFFLGYTYLGISWHAISTQLTQSFLSEGVSWSLGFLTCSFFVTILFCCHLSINGTESKRLLVTVSLLFGLSVVTRTTHLTYMLAFICMLIPFSTKSTRLQNLYWFSYPAIICVGLVLLLAVSGPGKFSHSLDHLMYSSSVSVSSNPLGMFTDGMPKLLPGPLELAVFCYFLVISVMCILTRIGLNGKQRLRKIVFVETALVIGVLLSLLVLQLPLISKAGYYPRPIIFSYHMLAVVAFVQLVRLTLMVAIDKKTSQHS